MRLLRATADLIEIADYVYAHNPAAAQRVRAAIYDSLQNLLLFPHVGRGMLEGRAAWISLSLIRGTRERRRAHR